MIRNTVRNTDYFFLSSEGLVSMAEERERVRQEEERRFKLSASIQDIEAQIQAVEARLRLKYTKK
jgi:hypothetical protein